MSLHPSPAERLANCLRPFNSAELFKLCDLAGISKRTGRKAAAGKAITTGHYLRLCAVAGIVPSSGAAAEVVEPGDVLWWFFGCGISVRRNSERLNLRNAALVIGVSPATLSRAENGKPIAIEGFLKICNFIGVPAGGYITPCNGPHENSANFQDVSVSVSREAAHALT